MDCLMTPGVLARLMETGQRPASLTVQVLGCRQIGEDRGKIQMMLWDGITLYKHSVLDVSISSLTSPCKYSIIRVSDSDRPATLAEHVVKQVQLKQGKTFSLKLQHYTMVKEGGQVGQILKPSGLSSQNTPQKLKTQPTVARTPAKNPTQHKVDPSHNNRQNLKRRNLDSALGVSPPKRGPCNPTHQVAAVHPYLYKYKLKVRVNTKSPVKKLNTKSFSGCVQDCIVSDTSGGIKVTAWASKGRDDTVHMDKLVVGSTYMLEGLKVKPVSNPQWNTTGHKYELTWADNTKASDPVTNNPVQQSYKFVPISTLANTPVNTVVDLLAWTKEVGELIEFRSRSGKDMKKREVVLADNSKGGHSVKLVLWEDQAEQYNVKDAIIAIKGAKVSQFDNEKNISLGVCGSYEVDPAVPEAAELKKWAREIS